MLRKYLSNPTLILGLTLVLFGLIMRLLPHFPNIAPIGAIAIFAGAKFSKKWAIMLPFIIMLISDSIIGFHNTIFYVWGSFILIALLSNKVTKRGESVLKIAGLSLSGSFLFFVITNFGVWAHSGMYAKTLEGLIQSYIMALPFYQQTVIGDGMFTLFLFGLYEIVIRLKETYSRTAELPLKNS